MKRIKTFISILLVINLLFIIVTTTVFAQQGKSKPIDNSEFIKQITDEIIKQNEKTQTTLQYLTVLIAVVTVVGGLMQFIHHRKEQDNRKKESDLFKKEFELLKQRIDQDYINEVKKTLKRYFDNHIEQYSKALKERLHNENNKYLEMLLKVEYAKKDIWDSYAQTLATTLNNDNIQKFCRLLTKFQDDLVAIIQLVSPKTEDIFTGLGHFKNKYAKDKNLSFSLWELIKYLNTQGRLKDLTVCSIAEDIGSYFNKVL